MKTRNRLPLRFEQAVLQETDTGHYYKTPTGNLYPSSTTILGATNFTKDAILNKWRDRIGHEVAKYITDESAIIGIEVHKMIECHIDGCFIDITPRLISNAHFENLMPYINKIGNFYGNEICLWNDALRIAGTADCIAMYDGKLSIIDYKSKRRPQVKSWLTDHLLQLTSYAFMFQALQGVKIEQVVLLISNEQNSRQVFVEDPRNFFPDMLKRIKLYYQGV